MAPKGFPEENRDRLPDYLLVSCPSFHMLSFLTETGNGAWQRSVAVVGKLWLSVERCVHTLKSPLTQRTTEVGGVLWLYIIVPCDVPRDTLRGVGRKTLLSTNERACCHLVVGRKEAVRERRNKKWSLRSSPGRGSLAHIAHHNEDLLAFVFLVGRGLATE